MLDGDLCCRFRYGRFFENTPGPTALQSGNPKVSSAGTVPRVIRLPSVDGCEPHFYWAGAGPYCSYTGVVIASVAVSSECRPVRLAVPEQGKGLHASHAAGGSAHHPNGYGPGEPRTPVTVLEAGQDQI